MVEGVLSVEHRLMYEGPVLVDLVLILPDELTLINLR